MGNRVKKPVCIEKAKYPDRRTRQMHWRPQTGSPSRGPAPAWGKIPKIRVGISPGPCYIPRSLRTGSERTVVNRQLDFKLCHSIVVCARLPLWAANAMC